VRILEDLGRFRVVGSELLELVESIKRDILVDGAVTESLTELVMTR
jgi:hypothetical protein